MWLQVCAGTGFRIRCATCSERIPLNFTIDLVRPSRAGHRAAGQARMHAVAVELDFMEPLLSVRCPSTSSVSCGRTHCGTGAVDAHLCTARRDIRLLQNDWFGHDRIVVLGRGVGNRGPALGGPPWLGSLHDSPLEGSGFELVWGFPCQAVFFDCQFFVRRCVQVRLACSAGGSPAGVKVRAP